MKIVPCVLFASVVSFVSPSLAADADPVNPAQILQELQTIQSKHEETSTAQQKQRLDTIFRAATSRDSAIAFYEDAQMATQFEGATRENGQFRDWKKRQEEQLKDSDFRESIRLHLYYLGLTLRRAAKVPVEQLVPQVADYLQALNAAAPAVQVKGSLLKVSVANSIFTNWLGLGPGISKLDDWEMNPGEGDRIAEKFLLPEWRKQKNPALITYWDARIAREANNAASAKLDFQQENFAGIRKPGLLWRRSQEFLFLDQPNRAAQEMFSLIKTYPNHPDVATWIAALQKQLAPGQL